MLSIEINNDVQLSAAFPGGEEARAAMSVLCKNYYKSLFFGLQLICNDLMAEDIGAETFTQC